MTFTGKGSRVRAFKRIYKGFHLSDFRLLSSILVTFAPATFSSGSQATVQAAQSQEMRSRNDIGLALVEELQDNVERLSRLLECHWFFNMMILY